MLNEINQNFKIVSAFAGRRWRLWEWVNGKIDRSISKRSPFTPSSLQEIWKKAYARELLDKDYLFLKKKGVMEEGWYLSEWVPKAPGQAWTESKLFDLSPKEIASGFRNPSLNSAPDKVRSIFKNSFLSQYCFWEMQYQNKFNFSQQGFGQKLGVYRPSLNDLNEDHYALLSITSGKEYMVDLAFPIIVSAQVYRKFIEYSYNENSVEIEGIIRLREINYSNEFKRYIKTTGATNSKSFEELIMSPVSIPNIVGEIISPLDISFSTNGSHPTMTLRVDGYNSEQESKSRIPAISRFIVTSPTDTRFCNNLTGAEWDKFRFGINWLLSDDYQNGTKMEPATDFDARIRHYSCDFPVKINPKEEME